LVSSTCAIHESIKRRLKKQEDLLDELEGLTPAQRAKRLAALQGRLPDAEQDEDDLDDAVRDQLVDEYTAALELEQLRAEIFALKELVEQARRVRENANDSKLADEATGEVFVKRVEVKGRLRGQPVRLTTNEWYKAQQLAETYWLYVVWGPLGDSPELVRIHNPVAKLDHAKKEIVAARFYEISADAVNQAALPEGGSV
jgi:hypothetical protein